MNRRGVVFALVMVLSCVGVAGAHDPFDPALKKLMPKDQLEFTEKVEALSEQHEKLLFRFRDSGQRQEENVRLGSEVTKLQEALVNKLKTEGLKGWVGKCGIIMPDNFVIFDRFQPYQLQLQMPEKKKAKGEIEKTIVGVKIDEVVRFSTKPDPTYALAKVTSKTHHGFSQTVKLSSITSVEIVPFTPTPPPAPAKAAAPNRKK